MLKICMLQFPTERRLLQFRVQRVENGDLEFVVYAKNKVVYGKKSLAPDCDTLTTG